MEQAATQAVEALRGAIERGCRHDEGLTIVSGNILYSWCSKQRCGALGMKPKGSTQRAFTWVQPGERGEDRAVEMRKEVNRQHQVDQCLRTR